MFASPNKIFRRVPLEVEAFLAQTQNGEKRIPTEEEAVEPGG